MVDVDRDSPTYLLGGIWPVTNYLYLYRKPLPGIANCDPRQFRERGGFCDELENKVLSNRSSVQDNETDRWSLNADVDVGDLLGADSGALTVRYTYGSTVTDTAGSRDGDNTDRVPSADNPFIPQDCVDQIGLAECQARGVRYQDQETAFFWDNDESFPRTAVVLELRRPVQLRRGRLRLRERSPLAGQVRRQLRRPVQLHQRG